MTKSQSWTDNLQHQAQVQNRFLPQVQSKTGEPRGTSVSATTSPINQPSIKKSSVSEYSLVSLTNKSVKGKNTMKPVVDPDSLIDLSEDIRASQLTKVSVLEAFDPLLGDIDDDLVMSSTPKKLGRDDKPDGATSQGYTKTINFLYRFPNFTIYNFEDF